MEQCPVSGQSWLGRDCLARSPGGAGVFSLSSSLQRLLLGNSCRVYCLFFAASLPPDPQQTPAVLCIAGHKLLSDCTAEKDSSCEGCEAGHFQSGWTKERHCTPHKSCDHNAGLDTRSPGDAKHNAVCECRQGMFCSSPDCQTCLKIRDCKPGEGVTQKGEPPVPHSPRCSCCRGWGCTSR
uniref:TNFR-Cys domain-containing protein n=1 Tax=Chelydra serpentina TaxID=8475 RepID=A0A8C3SP22_CHESE